MTRQTLIALVLIIASGTAGYASDRRPSVADEAKAYKKRHLPEAVADLSHPKISSEGKLWRVEFPPPPGVFGGGAIVWVSKKTHRGVKVLGLQ